MADFYKIHSKIWTDSWFYELDIYQQHLFIYLFSNSRATIAGIYELPIAVMAAEIKMAPEQIRECFTVFEAAGKAFYQDGVVWVKNLRQYHETSSPQLQKKLQREIEIVKDCDLKRRYLAHYNSDPIGPKEEEENGVVDLPFDGIDTISIPSGDGPSLVSSSIPSSKQRAREAEPPFVSAVTQRMQVIFDVCQLDPGVPAHRGQVEKAAAQLDNYSADEIRARFERPRGPVEGWNWYLHDFRGRKGEQPTPRWVIENISKQPPQPVGATPGGNGHDPWALIERAWKEGNGRIVLEDERVHAAVERMGGWLRFKEAAAREIPFLKRAFMEAYNASRSP